MIQEDEARQDGAKQHGNWKNADPVPQKRGPTERRQIEAQQEEEVDECARDKPSGASVLETRAAVPKLGKVSKRQT